MLNLEVKTKLSREEATTRLKKFFGEGGEGLALCDETTECITFEGGGGYVTVRMSAEANKTVIDLVTQEWDYQVKKFAESLPQ